MAKQVVKSWYEYDYGLTFGEGDVGIGGEHGADFNTPLFTPITALLPGTITGIQSNVDYGLTLTWQLDTPHNGVPHMYHLHLAAFAPGIQIGRHINAGTVIGYSGGATPASLAGDLADTPYTLLAGLKNYLYGPNSSEGAHVEVGFTYNSNYGEGGGFFGGYLQQLYWLLGSSVQKLALRDRERSIFPCLQTQEGWCTIRSRHQPTHAQQH